MKARLLVSLCAVGAAITVASCSKGLGNNPENPPGDTSPLSSNRPVGLDIGLQPTDPISGTCSTGVVVPAIGSFPERDIVLLAFTTASNAANADGQGTALSRDSVTDSNSASDVFVAGICSQEVDTRAFSQSLAGKFRHPRCTTCHSMKADDSKAFLSSATSMQTGGFQPHLGPATGSTFPNNTPAECVECHNSADTTFPVKDWQAPALSFDFRTSTVLELAIAAGNVPVDEPRHFITDPRVLWALDSGVLPTRGGRNGVADDDHDGIDEPSDRDGVIRIVPGGSPVFLQQIEEWTDGGFLTTAADAVCDITLVSRAADVAASGNGASSRPHVTWVANSAFSAPGRVGTLFVVFESDATNLIASDTNGATDIFRTAVDLISDSFGNLDLVVNGKAMLVSAVNGAITVGDGASTMASVGGTDGNLVAFQSLAGAGNLVTGFMDMNGPGEPDIYLRNIATNSTELISHERNNLANGGNAGSSNPAIAATGRAIAFESDATDLIGSDGNNQRDVFYTDISGGTGPFTKIRASIPSVGVEGTGGASRNASIYASPGGRTLVAYESDKTNLAPTLTATTNVYVFDSAGTTSTLLNQQLSSKSAAIGDGSARNPVIAADGANIAFESDATNIDFLRPGDLNGSTDVFLVDVTQALAGTILPHRFSVTTIESADGDGDSTEPCFGTFASTSSTFGVGFATYTTTAGNLGTPDSTDLMVAFLDETFGVLADFTATPTTGAIPLAVQFTDISVGTPTAWQWDFDNDGTVDSTEQSPSFTYTASGTFTVKLTASNDTGSDEVTKSDLVVAVGPPTTDFSATPTSGPASLAVQFTDTSTENPTSWLWDFGDSNSSTQQNPLHTYTTTGTYTVTLTTTNTAGSTTTTKANFIEVFTPVVAAFTSSVSSGTVPFAVTFTNASTGASSYSWDFGDGGSSTETSPTNTFNSSGSFTVTLTATGDGGVDTATDTITANGVVAASFTITISAATVTSGYSTSTITLDASASTNATTYQWDLNNNSTVDRTGVTVTDTVSTLFPVSAPNVSPFAESYTIRLIATGPGGTAQVTMPFTAVASSSTIVITAGQDGTIYEESTGNGSGGNIQMVAGNAASTTPTAVGKRRALMEFDVASNVPTGATVTAASLQLQCTFTAVTNPIGSRDFDLHRLTSAWTEGTTNTGSAGIGSAANPGDVTWAESTSGTTSWTTPGGDFSGTVSATRSVNALGSYTWASTSNMVTDAQLWLNTPANNHGWILTGEESPTTIRSVKWFGTQNNTTPNQPKMSVTFQRPL